LKKSIVIQKPVPLKRKAILTFCFILLCFLLKAQDTDTLLNLQTDSLSGDFNTVVDSAAVIETIHDEETAEEDEKDYFLKKEITANWIDSFQLRKLSDSALQAMRQDESFWYANAVFEKKKQKDASSRPRADLSWLNALLWIVIIGGFLTFIFILLTNSNVSLFRKSKNIHSEDGTEEYVETDDIFAINYQKEIDKAVNAGNFRLAVRFMFLRLLRNLSDKNIIQYTQDRTNFDYLLQVHNTGWYSGFFRIVRNYEYAWYGHFEVDKEKFDVIRKDFDGFDKQLNRN
jgi:hypothetical protein